MTTTKYAQGQTERTEESVLQLTDAEQRLVDRINERRRTCADNALQIDVLEERWVPISV